MSSKERFEIRQLRGRYSSVLLLPKAAGKKHGTLVVLGIPQYASRCDAYLAVAVYLPLPRPSAGDPTAVLNSCLW